MQKFRGVIIFLFIPLISLCLEMHIILKKIWQK